jgi:hypothetical protein
MEDPMTRSLLLATVVAITLAAPPARATPFGGDDTGNVPTDPADLNYEAKVGKLLAKFQKCVFKCHASRAAGKLVDDVNEDNCEAVCQSKYDAKASALVPGPNSGCVNTISIRNVWVANLDANSGQIYCEGTLPASPGDDTLKIPSTSTILKCEVKAGSFAAKLLKCQSKCHELEARGKLADDTAEEDCENGCLAKYNAGLLNLTGCDPCFNGATVASTLLALGDSNNSLVYCAP